MDAARTRANFMIPPCAAVVFLDPRRPIDLAREEYSPALRVRRKPPACAASTQA
jgi:hypothetical protein